MMQVALPHLLNSAGKMFTFAGILKILFVAHGAVPWAGESLLLPFTSAASIEQAVYMACLMHLSHCMQASQDGQQ